MDVEETQKDETNEVQMETRTNQRDKLGAESLPWVEKYRPSALDDLISHHDIISTIDKLVEADRLPHLLFYGPPGTGKTSAVLALARKINGPNFQSMVLELNASDDRGIEVVRDQIRDFASSRKLFNNGIKLIILDEADQMTKVAQFALRRIMEKYTRTTRFCLICNYVNKIIPALQSRCTRFRFGPLDEEQVKSRLLQITQAENVSIEPSGVQAIVDLANGDMRKVLNVAQACHLAYPKIDINSVYSCTGNPLPDDIKLIIQALLNQSTNDAYQTLNDIQVNKGLSLVDIITHLHDLVIRTSFPPRIMCFILSSMADLEYRLAEGGNEKIQLAALCGIFGQVKQMVMDLNQKNQNSNTEQLSQNDPI